jgi:putative heme-binding domain-containing protein
LKLAGESEVGVRRESLEALWDLKEPRAVPLAVAALGHPEAQMAAIRCIAEMGSADNAKALIESVRQNPSPDALQWVSHALTDWGKRDQAKWEEMEDHIAHLHGASGVLARWHSTSGPAENAKRFIEEIAPAPQHPDKNIKEIDILFSLRAEPKLYRAEYGEGLESRVHLASVKKNDGDITWFSVSDFSLPDKTDVQFLAGSNAAMRVYLNGKQIHKRDDAQPYRVDSERFDATLEKGFNRILIHFPAPKSDIDFHLRFRRKSNTATHEKLTQSALMRNGNVEKGRKLFFNIEKSQCLKCHRVGEQGEKIGPDLTGIGNRFSRIHLIESILEPSRTIASSFQTLAITLADGKTVTGVKIGESDKTIELGDKDGKKHVITKSDIESQRVEKLSVMPDGLEKPLSADEFVDLIAYLVNQKEPLPK